MKNRILFTFYVLNNNYTKNRKERGEKIVKVERNKNKENRNKWTRINSKSKIMHSQVPRLSNTWAK